MKKETTGLGWFIASCCIIGLLAGPRIQAATTQVQWILEAEEVHPGETIWAGFLLQMAPGYHTYWRNPGDSGLATQIQWKLPQGIQPGPIHWPPPERLNEAGIVSYVYHNKTMLLVPLRIGAEVSPGNYTLQAKVSWLECKESCMPGETTLTVSLRVGDRHVASQYAKQIAQWLKRLPRRDPSIPVSAWYIGNPKSEEVTLHIEVPIQNGFQPNDFWAYESKSFGISTTVTNLAVQNSKVLFEKIISRYDSTYPTRIVGLLVQRKGENGPPVRAVEVELRPQWKKSSPATAPATTSTTNAPSSTNKLQSSSAPTQTPQAQAAPSHSLLWMLFLAFLGGIILNVMPCVLPVIALKVLSFVQQSHQEKRRARELGIIYGLGVLVSFVFLAGFVIGIQKAHGVSGWGVQMQSIPYRVILLIVVTLVALNLFGVFEVQLSGKGMETATRLASREGTAGAFFSGVLATALATPCTAPFLATAVGYFLTQPPLIVLLAFLAVGLGLATPFVLLSWNPDWLRFLPKPGPWMNHFKVAMGFPMLGAAVWILDFTAPSLGPRAVLWLGLFLVILALAAWIWGQFVQRGTRNRSLAMGIAFVLVAGAYAYILEGKLHWRAPHAATHPTVSSGPIEEGGLQWHPWSPEAVAAARQAGHPVLVDFTARWCLTCQSNEKLAIEVESVRKKIRQTGTILFRADYTDFNPRIAQELKRFGRAGVPLVVVYPAATNQPPIVLPTLLTPGIVIDALERAAGSP